ncbi:MAG TPA: hypothetical protein VE869_07515, partial [Gemmatimonas sp.]|nr:hypothetical protein [Gemmatimonas sp.]
MRFRSLVALTGGLLAAGACKDDVTGVKTELAPAALIRYVNAVPDTSALDFRFVDGDVEQSPQFPGVTFRTFTAY